MILGLPVDQPAGAQDLRHQDQRHLRRHQGPAAHLQGAQQTDRGQHGRRVGQRLVQHSRARPRQLRQDQRLRRTQVGRRRRRRRQLQEQMLRQRDEVDRQM